MFELQKQPLCNAGVMYPRVTLPSPQMVGASCIGLSISYLQVNAIGPCHYVKNSKVMTSDGIIFIL